MQHLVKDPNDPNHQIVMSDKEYKDYKRSGCWWIILIPLFLIGLIVGAIEDKQETITTKSSSQSLSEKQEGLSDEHSNKQQTTCNMPSDEKKNENDSNNTIEETTNTNDELRDSEYEQYYQSVVSETRNDQIDNNEQPNRNDPCPCGSGKKYKRCCGMRNK